MAQEYLLQNGFSGAFVDRVAECIRVHSNHEAASGSSIEARILFDADKLDTAGALGIARILMYGAAFGEPLYIRDKDGRLQDGSREPERSFFREYHSDLSRVRSRLNTARARELAAMRMPAAEAFYHALLDEIRALDICGALLEKHVE